MFAKGKVTLAQKIKDTYVFRFVEGFNNIKAWHGANRKYILLHSFFNVCYTQGQYSLQTNEEQRRTINK